MSPSFLCSSTVAVEDQEDIRVPDDGVLRACLRNSETRIRLPQLLRHLSEDKHAELITFISEFPSLFSDTPSQTHLIKHNRNIGDALPSSQHFYRVSQERRTDF